jgi:hypothetical protein
MDVNKLYEKIVYHVRCSKCEHGSRCGKWISCLKGKGTFPKSAKFIKCSEYKAKEAEHGKIKKTS